MIKSICGFIAGAIFVAAMHVWYRVDSFELAKEIKSNEDLCQQEERPGFAVYPVTKYGEMRGCLRVRKDPVNGVLQAPILIVKHQQVM